MSNIIKDNQEALNEVSPLKINIAPVDSAPAAIKIAPDTLEPTTNTPLPPPIPVKVPAPLQTTVPQQQQSVEAPLPNVPYTAPPTGAEALSFGETVSRLSAQSAQSIQKILSESGQPKPNEVQKKLLESSNPVQIDPKLTSQNNPFKSSSEPRNAAERLAFEPPVLPNGLRNSFSNPNARAALAAGISKGEYLDYIQSLRDKGAQYIGFGERDVTTGGYTDTTGKRVMDLENFTGLSADQIRQKMKDRVGFYSTQLAFNQSFLPFLGDDRGSLETLFGVLSFPANLVKGIAADVVIRPTAALASGTKLSQLGNSIIPLTDWDAVKKAYDEMRPTRGGGSIDTWFGSITLPPTFTGAAILGEQFQSLAVADEKGKPFNPFAAVLDDNNLLQVGGAFLFDLGADPFNFGVGKAFNRFRRSAVTPPSIIPEVLPPTRRLPPSNVAGVLPETRTIDVLPYTPDVLPYTPERLMIEGALDTPAQFFPARTGNVNVNVPRVSLPELYVPEPAKPSGTAIPKLDIAPERPAPLPDLSAIPVKRAEPSVAASYESLAKYEPSEVVFPVPRQPFTASLDAGGAIVKVEPADVQLYNNVTALFNDSPQLPAIQQAVREVVEQRPVTVELPKNSVLQEVLEYGRTGELTPNIAVLKGATPDEVRAIVQDRLEVIRDTPLVVPRLEVQPIKVPKLEFDDITRQAPRQQVFASTPLSTAKILSLDSISTPNPNLDSALVDSLAREMVSASDNIRPIVVERVSPVEYKVISGEVQYAAAKRAAELDPNFEVRSVVVEKGTPQYDAVMRQENAYKEIEKLSQESTLTNTAKNTTTYEGTKTEKQLGTTTGSRTIELDSITTQRGGAYSKEAVEVMARNLLETGGNTRPIVVRRTNPTDFELIRGNLEYLAAKRASEINPQFTGVRALVVDAANEAAILRQLDIVDGVIPVPTSKPIVVTDSTIASVADLQDAAKGLGTFGEVSQWSVRGDFVTPLKDVLNAVDDLGLNVLNTPALSRMVKGGIGKLSNKTVEGVASSLQKVSLETAEDIAKSIFDALWRKSTPDQKEIILGKISTTRLEQLGLERVQTKIVPPTTPAPLQYVQAELSSSSTPPTISITDAYQVVNDSQVPLRELYEATMRVGGSTTREAAESPDHYITRQISTTGGFSDRNLKTFIDSGEMSGTSVTQQKWASKMLKEMWEVATPRQKAYIMKKVDNLEQLGLERIARSNVIDDHLPPEGVFDTPC